MVPPSSKEGSPTHRGATDTALVQPEQLFRAIFEQAAVGVALIETATGRFVRINQRYCGIVGLSRDDMTATTFMAITHPDDLRADLDNMEELKAGRIREFCMEKRYFRPDGSIVWVDLTVSPLWEAGEQPSSHIAVVQDITKRKEAESKIAEFTATLEQEITQRTKELRNSRHQLEAIVEGTSDAVFLKDAQGRYLLFNEAAGRFVGKRSDEVLGRDDRFIFPPSEAQTLMEHDRRTMAGGKALSYEEILTTADGTTRTFHSTKGPVFDEQGHIAGLFGISRDITARKQAEEALRQLNVTLEQRVVERTESLRVSEQFRKEILDSLSPYVAVLDANGVIVTVNRVWERAAQRNDPSGLAQVSLGANYVRVCERAANKSPEARRTLQGICDVLAGRKDIFECEYLCVWPGHHQWFSLRVTPLSDHRGCVIAHEDITERKRAEEALRDSYQRLQALSREVQATKERERSRLSRELHDEFGQVLSGLKLELTKISAMREGARKTSAIGSKLNRAIGMVDRLFQSLREMVAALRPSLLEELGLRAALEALVDDLTEESYLRCRIVADGIDTHVRWSPEVEIALFRIAQELLSNVIHHAKATTITITLASERGEVILSVQDNGRGFALPGVRKKNHFGLRGVQERAELLGGSVTIDSTRQVGTTVTVRIPVEVPASVTLQKESAKDRTSTTPPKRSRRGK